MHLTAVSPFLPPSRAARSAHSLSAAACHASSAGSRSSKDPARARRQLGDNERPSPVSEAPGDPSLSAQAMARAPSSLGA